MTMRTVYTCGTFDLFHAGHLNFLLQCKKIAGEDGEVVVALNTDEFIEKYKGKPPIYSYKEREGILKWCRLVDDVIPNKSGKDSKPTILKVKPSFIVIGDDWAIKDYYKQMDFTQEWLNTHNILLCYVPYTKWISTTKIKEIICSQ